MLAVCSGALVVQMAVGFGVLGAASAVNIIGKGILNAIAVFLLAWFALRLQRHHTAITTLPHRPPTASSHPARQRG